jgi:transcription initiation factor IIE alpha subunit
MANKDLRKIIQALEDQGFAVSRTKKGHLRVLLNGVWVTTLPGTPSDWRSFRNALAAAKRAGFQWPP